MLVTEFILQHEFKVRHLQSGLLTIWMYDNPIGFWAALESETLIPVAAWISKGPYCSFLAQCPHGDMGEWPKVQTRCLYELTLRVAELIYCGKSPWASKEQSCKEPTTHAPATST